MNRMFARAAQCWKAPLARRIILRCVLSARASHPVKQSAHLLGAKQARYCGVNCGKFAVHFLSL